MKLNFMKKEIFYNKLRVNEWRLIKFINAVENSDNPFPPIEFFLE